MSKAAYEVHCHGCGTTEVIDVPDGKVALGVFRWHSWNEVKHFIVLWHGGSNWWQKGANVCPRIVKGWCRGCQQTEIVWWRLL